MKRAVAAFVTKAGDPANASESTDPVGGNGSRDVGAAIGGVPTVPPLYEGDWPEMAAQAALLGFVVTGTNERFTADGKPAHNVGSAHYDGYAIDVRTWDHPNEQIEAFMTTMRGQGYIVLDERIRPPGQLVWRGPHVHVEAFRWDKFRDALRPLEQFRR